MGRHFGGYEVNCFKIETIMSTSEGLSTVMCGFCGFGSPLEQEIRQDLNITIPLERSIKIKREPLSPQ